MYGLKKNKTDTCVVLYKFSTLEPSIWLTLTTALSILSRANLDPEVYIYQSLCYFIDLAHMYIVFIYCSFFHIFEMVYDIWPQIACVLLGLAFVAVDQPCL